MILIVGDTWCAVTDPLRYHSRISYLKSWCLIGVVWTVSLLLGAISAFRSRWCTIEQNGIHMHILATPGSVESNDSLFTANIYALAFSSLFLVLIILVPFVVVCLMYWMIFSEARQSGQRMRRNGSSPLLQSSLNLNSSSVTPIPINDTPRYPSLFDVSTAGDAITMKIDAKQCDRRKSITPIATHQYRRYLDLPDAQFMDADQSKCDNGLIGPKPPKMTQLQRNFSARQLVDCQTPTFLTKSCNIGRILTNEMRQVHSSPNLQRLANLDMLQKYPYCLNDSSTSNISQTSSHQQQAPPKALSYMISIRHRLSNASSIFKYREESRAARIGIVVVGIFLISYIPYGLSLLLQGRVTFIGNASVCHILFLLIANIALPFVFAYRNRRVRRGVCRLFGVDTKSNSYLQKQRMQLRGQTNGAGAGVAGANNGHAKRVRIHRNLSASNFSLNMLPYKLAAQSMLPIQAMAKVDEISVGALSESYASGVGGGGSFLVPIDDVEIEGMDTIAPLTAPNSHRNAMAGDGSVHDINNNTMTATPAPTKLHKDKLSLFHLMRGNPLRKSMTHSDCNECSGNCDATKENNV